MRYKHIKTLAVTAAVALAACTPAQAQLVFTIQETGSGVTTTGAGSILFNQAALTPAGGVTGGFMQPSLGTLVVGGPSSHAILYGIMTGPSSFGSFTLPQATSNSGDRLGFNNGVNVELPQSYISGSPLSGSSFYSGATLASLGLAPGTFTWTTQSGSFNDTITLNITAVPEPHEYALMAGLGLIGFAGFRRWRQRA